jgi:hypothetical protein
MHTCCIRNGNILIAAPVMLLAAVALSCCNKPAVIHDPFGHQILPARVYTSAGGTATPAPGQNVFPEAVDLITPEDPFFANTTVSEMVGLCKQIDAVVQQVFSKNDDEFKLLIQIAIYPAKHFGVKLATHGPADEQKLQMLYDRLLNSPTIYSKSDDLVFQVRYTVRANQ